MTTNFVYDQTDLPINKIDIGPLQPGTDPNEWAVAQEWKTVLQASYDLRGAVLNAKFLGFAPQSTDPVPSGIPKYLWVRDDGQVMKTIDGVASVVGGGGAAIFDDSGGSAVKSNVRTDRATAQSPIDNTKSKIVNLGSQTHTNDATAAGVTANAGTIGGGDDNTVDADYGTVAGGYGNHAHGLNAAIPGGLNNKANGIASFAMGEGCVVSGEASGAVGDGCEVAGEQGAFAFGNGCIASGDSAIAAGTGSIAAGDYSVAIGDGCIATGPEGAMAVGDGCSATGESSFAQGDGSAATALAACALGLSVASGIGALAAGSSVAVGNYSTALGQAYATRDGQLTFSSNVPSGAALGDSQDSKMTLYGKTPGSVGNETVELLIGTKQLILEDNKAYMFSVRVSAGGLQGGTPVGHGWVIELCCRRSAGTTTIVGTTVTRTYSETATNDWTFAVTVGTTPDRLQFQFTTGATTTAAKVTACVDFTVVKFA